MTLRGAQHDHSAGRTLDLIIEARVAGSCPGLDFDRLAALVEALLTNPTFRRSKTMGNLYVLRGRIYDVQGDTRMAAAALREAYKWRPDYGTAVIESHRWAVSGEYEEALEAVRRAKLVAGRFTAEARHQDLQPWIDYLSNKARATASP